MEEGINQKSGAIFGDDTFGDPADNRRVERAG
jgi:hypothetical protein